MYIEVQAYIKSFLSPNNFMKLEKFTGRKFPLQFTGNLLCPLKNLKYKNPIIMTLLLAQRAKSPQLSGAGHLADSDIRRNLKGKLKLFDFEILIERWG